MSRVLPSLLSLALALAPAAALAQPAGDATELDDVVVTATRTATTVDDALAAVEVIDRDEIERSQAASLPELLRGHAGITLSNQGGLGKLTTLFLRGTESDHVLVLVDGVRIGGATSGLAALQDLPVEQIDRIEIVRGPRSSLYGADAIGGVIQVFTRRGRDAAHARAGIGSHGLREASAGFGAGDARAWIGADVAYQRTDGIDACRGSSVLSAGCFAEEPDRDGYRNRSLSLRGGFAPTEAFGMDVHALRAEGRNEFDSSALFGLPNVSDTVQQVVGAGLRYAPGDRLALRASVGRDEDDSHDSRDGIALSRFDGTRDSASLQGDIAVADGQLLTLGFDWLRDRVDSDTAYATTSRGNRALFAQYQGRFGAGNVQLSARRDDNDQFGGHTTGGAAFGIGFGGGYRAYASIGSAFKAPTFNELYYPFFGNPALKPESSRSAELGLRHDGARWDWSVDAFETRIDDLIAYDAALGLPANIDRARIRGAEATLQGGFAGWTLSTQASVADPRSDTGAHDGNRLPRRARETARADLDRGFGRWKLGATWIAEGGRYDDLANSRRLGGYATFDLRAEFAVARGWTLQGRIANLFDRDYETAAFYNQPGREFALSVRYAADAGR